MLPVRDAKSDWMVFRTTGKRKYSVLGATDKEFEMGM